MKPGLLLTGLFYVSNPDNVRDAMDIRQLFETLDIDPDDFNLEFWQEALDAARQPDSKPLLDLDRIETICEWIGFRDEVILACLDAARRVHALPEACELLQAARHIFLETYHDPRINTNNWPMPCPNHWPSPSMFYMVVFLNCAPHLQAIHQQQGVPEQATRDILLDLESKIDIFIRLHSYPGLNTFRWFAEHFNGQIFHLGRLQFQFSPFYPPLSVFKHVSDDKLAVLAHSDQKFRPDGQYFNADKKIEPENSIRTSVLTENETTWRGTPILPRGCAAPNEITLSKNEWQLVLKQGDPTLNIHIPANTSRNAPLTREACAESFKLAMEFFPKYFPDFDSKAFMCQTWMLDVQLSDYLPPTSNLVQFQQWFHLYPVPAANDFSIINFIFGSEFPGWDAAPQKTSLHKIAVRHVRNGHAWHFMGGFCLNEEIRRLII
jgi:hypothetical protein